MRTTSRYLLLVVLMGLTACSRKEQASKPESEARKETNIVEMKAEAQEHIGLRVEPAKVKELNEYLQVTGTVQAIDTRVGQVRPLARGRVQQVLVKVGERVKAGQTLALFDNIEAGELLAQQNSARADLQRLRVQLATQAKQIERNRQLVEIGAAPQKDLEASQGESEALRESIRSQESTVAGIVARLRRYGVESEAGSGPVSTALRSPFAGVVTKAQVAPGDMVDESKELFTVADLSEVWVQAEVYEKDLGKLRLGQGARIVVDTYPGERFAGRVSYISDILDPQTRTARVRCEVSNPGIRLKLDMFATVQLPTTFSRRAMAVPDSALQQVDDQNVVFVRKATTTFEVRHVEVGKTVNGLVEIVSGLREGDQLVTQGAFHLKSIAVGKELGEE
jgi:cobalt-zinc-cadmium efflux system membrane fusion protein